MGDKRYQNIKITGSEQKRLINAQDGFNWNYFKNVPVKFLLSAWDEEKNETNVAKQRITCLLREYLHYLLCRKGKNDKNRNIQLWYNQEEANAKIFFYVGHLVAPNNVVVRKADTDVLTLQAVVNMEKLPASINVWLEMGLNTNNSQKCKCE